MATENILVFYFSATHDLNVFYPFKHRWQINNHIFSFQGRVYTSLHFASLVSCANIYVLSPVQLPLLWWLKTFFESKLEAEKISCFEMTNFQALDTLTIYSNISKIRLLIQITLCRNARIQIVISRKNRFSAEKAINYFPSHWEKKKGTNMWNDWLLWVFLLSHAFSWELKIIAYKGSFKIPSSSKLELLCQCKMTSWYIILSQRAPL